MIDIRKNVLSFIVEKLEQEKITQTEFANYLGLPKSTINKWTTGKNAPNVDLLPKIAEFFKVSLATLMGINDDRNEYSYTNEEIKLIEAYRKAPDGMKEAVDKLLNIKK